jgi:hypothetical protein
MSNRPRHQRRYVRLVPVFGSPVWLRRAEAQRQLVIEDAIYARAVAAGYTPTTSPRIA